MGSANSSKFFFDTHLFSMNTNNVCEKKWCLELQSWKKRRFKIFQKLKNDTDSVALDRKYMIQKISKTHIF